MRTALDDAGSGVSAVASLASSLIQAPLQLRHDVVGLESSEAKARLAEVEAIFGRRAASDRQTAERETKQLEAVRSARSHAAASKH